MKIPFDIKYRPRIASGEYKVETFSGYPVTIYRWDFNDGGQTPIIGSYVFEDGKEYVGAWNEEGHFDLMSPNDLDLFIITPEPELTSWQTFISGCLQKYGLLDCGAAYRIAKECSAELLELAKDEIYSHESLVEYAKKAKEEGKAEALITRATELTKNLNNSGMDNDSIPYHLIEFMCNLYTCQSWKEIEETAEAYVTRIKAAAMKDLPRWEKAVGYCFVGPSIMYDNFGFYKSSTTKPGCRYITYESLRILPGFNE